MRRNNTRGILELNEGKIISPGVIIVSTEKEDSFKSFMDYWKIEYKIQRIMV